jgi:hypothetical protein
MHKTYAKLKGIATSKIIIISNSEQHFTGGHLYYFNPNFGSDNKSKSLKTKIQNIVWSIKAMRNKRKGLAFAQFFPDCGSGFGDGLAKGDGHLHDGYEDDPSFEGELGYSHAIYYLLYDV